MTTTTAAHDVGELVPPPAAGAEDAAVEEPGVEDPGVEAPPAPLDAAPAPASSAPAGRTVRGYWRWLGPVCAGLAVIGLGGAGFFGRAWWSQRSANSSSQQQAAQVRSTAGAFVSALTNFDPGTVDADFARIQADATGAFATQARQYFGTSIRQQLQAAGAASRGQIADLFVESLNGDQASVFAVVDQTYLNDKMTSPASDTLRLEVVMSDLASGWHISAVTVLQSPAGFPAPKG